jgi:hypothetical protein
MFTPSSSSGRTPPAICRSFTTSDTELESYTAESVEDEISEAHRAIILNGLVMKYHSGVLSYDDIDSFVPSFSGLTKEQIDEVKVNFLNGQEKMSKELHKLLEAVKTLTSELSGMSFEETFSLGYCIFTSKKANEKTGNAPHHRVLLSHSAAVRFDDEKFEEHKEITNIVDSLWKEIGGQENFRRSLFGTSNTITFDHENGSATASYVEHKNLDSEHVQKYAELKSTDLDLPIHIYF